MLRGIWHLEMFKLTERMKVVQQLVDKSNFYYYQTEFIVYLFQIEMPN